MFHSIVGFYVTKTINAMLQNNDDALEINSNYRMLWK